jgi:hypothetical protein
MTQRELIAGHFTIQPQERVVFGERAEKLPQTAQMTQNRICEVGA